jgi:hypothetical protein
MKHIQETAVEPMTWTGKWDYELRTEKEIVGLLHMDKQPGMRAQVECADGSWVFKKKWFPFEKVSVYPGNQDTEIATFRNKRIENRALLDFPYDQRFYWMPQNFWLNEYTFTNLFGDPILHFKRNSNPLTVMVLPKGTSTGKLTIENEALSLPELPLLTLLGCYLMITDSI